MSWSMAPVQGDPAALQAVLQGPADDWSPGQVVMHSPRHVRTVVRVWGFPVDMELLLDGPDVRPMADRRQLLVLPRKHWLPELDGVLHFVDSVLGTHRRLLAYDWSVQRDGSLPGPLVPPVAGAIADAVIRPAAMAIERLAGRPR